MCKELLIWPCEHWEVWFFIFFLDCKSYSIQYYLSVLISVYCGWRAIPKCLTIAPHSSALVNINFNWILLESWTHSLRQSPGHKKMRIPKKRHGYVNAAFICLIFHHDLLYLSSMILVVEVVVFYSLPDSLFFHLTQCFVYLRCTYLSIPAEET